MKTLLLAILSDITLRLTDPRRWVQGTFEGIRSGSNVRAFHTYQDRQRSNCWCLSTALTLAVGKVLPGDDHDGWCDLRDDVERELLATIEARTGARWPVLEQWNDSISTAHADVLAVVTATRERLQSAS